MLKERGVFQEIIRLVGLGLLVYGLLIIVQTVLSLLYNASYDAYVWLMLARPLIYALIGLYFLLRSASITIWAYPCEQMEEWSHRRVFTMGIKLTGLWLILAHLGSFLQQLRYYLGHIHMLGRYQVLTHSIWPVAAVYIILIIIGLTMFRYQPRNHIEEGGNRT